MNKTSLNSILLDVIGSIEEESVFYPLHTTEQLLMGFFCERFDNEDIWKLVNILDDDIVDIPRDSADKRIVVHEPLLGLKKLNEIARKDAQKPYDIDTQF